MEVRACCCFKKVNKNCLHQYSTDWWKETSAPSCMFYMVGFKNKPSNQIGLVLVETCLTCFFFPVVAFKNNHKKHKRRVSNVAGLT